MARQHSCGLPESVSVLGWLFSFSSFQPYLIFPRDRTWNWNRLETGSWGKDWCSASFLSLGLYQKKNCASFYNFQRIGEHGFRTTVSIYSIQGWNPSFKQDCKGLLTTVLTSISHTYPYVIIVHADLKGTLFANWLSCLWPLNDGLFQAMMISSL